MLIVVHVREHCICYCDTVNITYITSEASCEEKIFFSFFSSSGILSRTMLSFLIACGDNIINDDDIVIDIIT